MPEATIKRMFFNVKPPVSAINDQHSQSQINTNRIKPANFIIFINSRIPEIELFGGMLNAKLLIFPQTSKPHRLKFFQ